MKDFQIGNSNEKGYSLERKNTKAPAFRAGLSDWQTQTRISILNFANLKIVTSIRLVNKALDVRLKWSF